MFQHHRWMIIVVSALATAAVLAACARRQEDKVQLPGERTQGQVVAGASESAPGGAQLAEKQVLILGWPVTDLNPADPARASTGDIWFLATEVFDGLVRYPPGSGDVTKLEPDLAEKWDVSSNGLTWTFYLRRGVPFHRGYGEFTAEDVKYTFERLADPAVKASYGRPNWAGIDVVDPYTVRIHLKRPDGFFLNEVSNWNGGWIVSKKAAEEMGLESFSRNPVGTGAFQVDRYVPKESLSLKANPDYFRGKPVLEAIEIKFMGADENVRALALRNGDIHVARSMNNADLLSALVNDGFKVAGRWGQRRVLHFKLTEKPLDNLKLRQAIAYAINRDVFKEASGNTRDALYAHFTPGQAFALKREDLPAELRYDYNQDKARQLLAEAGYPNGFSLKLVVPERSFLDDLLIVQDQLKKVGIVLDMQIVDWNKWLATTRQGTNPIDIWSGFESTPDQAVRDFFHSDTIVGKTGGVRNWSHYGEAVGSIDKVLDEVAGVTDAAKQRSVYREIQLQLLRDLPSFPLNYQTVMQNAYSPKLDLGYGFINSLQNDFPVTEKTRLLK